MVSVSRYLISLEKWHQLVETGVFAGEKLELRGGEIFEVTPIGERHAALTGYLQKRLERRFGDRAVVFTQNPFEPAPPEPWQLYPDLMLLKPREDFYYHKIPRAEDVLLLVEIADKSLREDKRRKLEVYAKARVPEVWLVDVGMKTVTSYSQPKGSLFATEALYLYRQPWAPLAFQGESETWLARFEYE
ncbi:MAG: Uma2 family endonuclease [Trueperaceae bacterium]|nr:MAG: Uma2 family endonuclease [Trueperaceae bacterium]